MPEKPIEREWDRFGVIEKMVGGIKIPDMFVAGQSFERKSLDDISAVVRREMTKAGIAGLIKPGMGVAITAGSRGIANIDVILKETVAAVKAAGGEPFIFPAMGSHGGATAQGQLQILADYGVTAENVGAPIKASMDTVVAGRTKSGKPVYIDKYADAADAILPVARIKPHTAFRNVYESGILKMLVIGAGKQKGAESCHNDGWGKMAANIEECADIILAKKNIPFGIGIVENAFDEVSIIEAIPAPRIKEREAALLKIAKEKMAKIYLNKFDILIVDQIGKNFSGDGADPNITATYGTPYASGGPEFDRYVILDISDESHGNATGIGLADFSVKRLFDKIDFDVTYPNNLTSTVPMMSKVPMILKNDKTAIQAAIYCCVGADKENPKIVRIKNTAHLDEIMISRALIDEAAATHGIKILREAGKPLFDADGNLSPGRF